MLTREQLTAGLSVVWNKPGHKYQPRTLDIPAVVILTDGREALIEYAWLGRPGLRAWVDFENLSLPLEKTEDEQVA